MEFPTHSVYLPKQIGQMSLVYDATGRKWFKHGEFGTTGYVSGIEYHDGKLEAIYAPDGRMVAEYTNGQVTRYRAEYFQDHPDPAGAGQALGNTRLGFSDFNQNGRIELAEEDPNTPDNELEVTQEAHYYPFGMNQDGPWYATVAPENKYLYNGKEFSEDFGIKLMDYGARWYDGAIGRWTAVDPLAEEYYPYSPYNYTLGNPISLIDPNGMSVDDIYFLFWPGDEDKPGHAAVAIDEYDDDGNKTGNVIVFELFPGEEYGTFDMPTSNMDGAQLRFVPLR